MLPKMEDCLVKGFNKWQSNLHITILVPVVAKSKANAQIKRIENQIKTSSPLAQEKGNK